MSDSKLMSPNTPQSKPKSPLLAAALNLIPLPFALGYAYLGEWGRFWGAIIPRLVAAGFGFIFVVFTALECVGNDPVHCYPDGYFPTALFKPSALPLLVPLFVLVFSARSAYREARQRD